MKRIFMLTTHPVAPPWDSADKQLARSIAGSLPEYRFLLFGRRGIRQNGANTTYVPLLSRNGKPGLTETVQVAVLSGILERRADLVHAVVTVGRTFGDFCDIRARVPRSLRRPMVLTVPGISDPRHLPTRRPADAVFALSDSTADVLRAAGFHPVGVIPPGIPLEAWPLSPLENDGPPSVLFAGHYDPGGGAENAILAVAQIAEGARPRLVLAMRGRDASRDREEARLRGLATTVGVHLEVHNEVSDMASLIRAATAVVFPTAQVRGKADVPLTLLEAMATGRPVVAARTPSLAAVREGARLITPGDAAALAAELRSLARDPHYRDERAKAGRRLVERQFSEAAMARAYAEVYEELLR